LPRQRFSGVFTFPMAQLAAHRLSTTAASVRILEFQRRSIRHGGAASPELPAAVDFDPTLPADTCRPSQSLEFVLNSYDNSIVAQRNSRLGSIKRP